MANIDLCENMARMLLKNELGSKNPTEENIKKVIEKVSGLMPMIDLEKAAVEKQLQSSYKVRMDLGEKIVDPLTYHPWLSTRMSTIKPYYWNRYKKHLIIDQGWNENVVETLGDVSNEILDLLGDPEAEGIWKRKGLILGDIQSGKTSNYTALCNKAADAGYKVIILLTGTIEALRKQTQERIDAGFVGLNSRNVLQKNPEKKYVGVGNQDSNRTAYPFTTVLQDFNSTKLQSLNFTIKGLNEPVVLVIKKNKSVLENLETWLRTRNTDYDDAKIDLPLLLIDDEADNASVNTNKEEDNPTAINKGIKSILNLFQRSSYVAVTATPFANIFIDPDKDIDIYDSDLFPSDFIYALSPPTNYIGSQRIFGAEAEYSGNVETIEDVLIDGNKNRYVFRSKDKSGHIIPYMPLSIQEALAYFLIVNTVRDLDGNMKSHRSMLINVSQFVNVQNQLYDMVIIWLKKYKEKVQAYSKLSGNIALKNQEIAFIKNVWDKHHMTEITGYHWKEVQEHLYESVTPIEVRLVNQKSKQKGVERLDYEPYSTTGLRVIAIGGNSLSRGLTLEGLCVSYFDRNSQMYDTLMQMGRWFGYRNGYENIFKVWMEADAISWYQYITEATAELREEIFEMKRVGLTPKDFGLKVRQDKTALFVTARNKMRATSTVERWISLAAELIETPRLIANKDNFKINIKITDELLRTLLEGDYTEEQFNNEKNGRVFTNVPSSVIADYVKKFISHPRHISFSAKDLSIHIKNSVKYKKWTVAIIGGSGQEISAEYFSTDIVNMGVKCSSRVITKSENCLLISGERARVGVPGATRYGLSEMVRKSIEEEYKKTHTTNTIPDKPYLKVDRDPILLIYIIQIDKEHKEKRVINSDKESIRLVDNIPIIGLGIGFPGIDGETQSAKVKYVLNRVEERNQLTFEEDDEFDAN